MLVRELTNMKKFIMPQRVAFDKVGDTEISTVKLNSAGWGYETCMFYADGHSDVVSTYDTLKDALSTHEQIVAHEKNHLVAKNKFLGDKHGNT